MSHRLVWKSPTSSGARRLDDSWSLRGGDPLRYDPTNEPGIHAPWLYNELGQPWTTQETVREIVNTVYITGAAGLPGNDDLGTMSAWYVFAAVGIYPRAPDSADLLLSSPLFPQALVQPDRAGPTLITASSAGRYVHSVRRNGRPHRDWKVDGDLFRRGGVLSFELGSAPNRDWARP